MAKADVPLEALTWVDVTLMDKTEARVLVAEMTAKIRETGRLSQADGQRYYEAIHTSKDTSPAQLARLKELPKGWRREHFRNVLLSDWALEQEGEDSRVYKSIDGLVVLVSADVELDGKRWLHVSCSRADKLPSWNDLRRVKDLFVGMNQTAIQVLPKQSKYVNIHPRVLHLFRCLDGDPLPDFTRGTESL